MGAGDARVESKLSQQWLVTVVLSLGLCSFRRLQWAGRVPVPLAPAVGPGVGLTPGGGRDPLGGVLAQDGAAAASDLVS